MSDNSKPQMWSDDQLNEWLQGCLKAEREEIRKLVVAAMTSNGNKRDAALTEALEAIVSQIDTGVEQTQAALDKIAGMFALQVKRMDDLESEITLIKASKPTSDVLW